MNSDKTGESRLKPRSVELLREPVELYKVLKFEGLVASGGEAKAAIDAGLVFVNDKVERQKRKKLVNGDTVRMGEESLILKLAENYDPASEPVKAKVNKIAPAPPAKKDWRRKRTPAQIDADAAVVADRKPQVASKRDNQGAWRSTLGARSKKTRQRS